MDLTALLTSLFGNSDLNGAPLAPPVLPAGPTVPPPGASYGPPAPFPPVQGFEPTNVTTGFGAPKSVEPYMSEPMPAGPVPSLGQSLEPAPQGVPLPKPRPADAPTAAQANAQQGAGLLKTLQGVQMPKPPEAQKVATPHLPTLRPIQGGGIFDLLASLGMGPQQALPGLKLPSTLGAALAGGR